jgi:hypothetical protein
MAAVTDAGVLEVTETIEHLDEEWPCFHDGCDAAATWQLVAKPCGCITLACTPHKIQAEFQINLLKVIADFKCRDCGANINADEARFIPL